MKGISVSIIVCVFNGCARMEETLEAIVKLSNPSSFELIVVDNGSTDGTADFVIQYLNDKSLPFNFQLIKESKPGLLHARIAGIKAAQGDYILFCDDDNALFPDYLEIGVRILESNPTIGALGGMGIAKLDFPKPDWFKQYQKSYAIGPQAVASGAINHSGAFVYGAGAFFRKAPLLEVLETGFSPVLTGRMGSQLIAGDDVEWCWLLKLKGYQIAYEEGLKFYHSLPERRVDRDYYIQLKKGIAAGSGLLFVYDLFWDKPNLGKFQFQFGYQREVLKAVLVYIKNRLLPPAKNQWETRLAIGILESRKNSFKDNAAKAWGLYQSLQAVFGTAIGTRND